MSSTRSSVCPIAGQVFRLAGGRVWKARESWAEQGMVHRYRGAGTGKVITKYGTEGRDMNGTGYGTGTEGLAQGLVWYRATEVQSNHISHLVQNPLQKNVPKCNSRTFQISLIEI